MLGVAGGSAFGQVNRAGIEEAPTRGVYQPGAGIADGAEPFSAVLNPAALGDGSLRGFTLGLRHTETAADTAFSGRGTGIYAAAALPNFGAPRFLGWLARFQVGAALEVLRPPLRVPLASPGVLGKLTLALGYRPLSWLSLGLSYGHLFAPASPRFDNLNTLDLGVRARLGGRVALGLVLRDLPGPADPRGAAPPLSRVYEGEALLRALGDDRLEIGLGAAVGERYGDVEPRLRLWVRPRPGVALGAEGTLLFRAPESAQATAWRVAAGLQLDLARVGAAVFGLFGSDLNGDVGAPGGAVALRYSADPRPALVERGDYVLKIGAEDLHGVAALRLLLRLRELEEDRRLRAVLLSLKDGLPMGWGRADELREELLRLRRAGKRVYAYGVELNSRAYYVATAAERIFLHPQGAVWKLGLVVQHWNVKEALDHLGVRAEFLHIGEYKSYGDTFTRTDLSPPDREQTEARLEVVYQRLLAALTSGRNLAPARAEALVDRGAFTNARAIEAGLVDRGATLAEAEQAIRDELGKGVRIVGDLPEAARPRRWQEPRIAILRISGDIVGGHTPPSVPLLGTMSGSETVIEALAQAQADPLVRAVVLRIDSPGGEGLAGAEITEQVQKTRKRKPVVCSFADTAASAAYMLAAGCDAILTNPSTITGSIGIFLPRVDVEALFARLGLRRHALARGKHADLGQPISGPVAYRPFTGEERALVMEDLRQGYERFLDVVAQGRRMKRAEVDALARGRVWVGAEAVKNGLCDRLGGLADAVAEARARAHLLPRQPVEVRYYPESSPSLISEALGWLGTALGPRMAELLEDLPLYLLLVREGPLERLEGPFLH